jgi:hypothetical protein
MERISPRAFAGTLRRRVDPSKGCGRGGYFRLAVTEPVGTASFRPLRSSWLHDFKAFSAGVQQRCDELPVTTEWSEVGSYAFFGR